MQILHVSVLTVFGLRSLPIVQIFGIWPIFRKYFFKNIAFHLMRFSAKITCLANILTAVDL